MSHYWELKGDSSFSALFKVGCYRLLLMNAHRRSCLMEPDLLQTQFL